MANLKEIRTRISSVKSTKQITNAMKMVAASKMRKAQDAITKLRPYSNKLNEILSHISSESDADADNIYATEKKEDKILLIGLSSNKGLCGPFNTNVAKKIMELTQNQYSEQMAAGNVDIITVGKKVADVLRSKKYKIKENFDYLFDDLSYENAKTVAEKFMNTFTEDKYDRIDFIYNQFKNAAVQILTQEQFLPIKPTENKGNTNVDYIFEPSKEYIIENLIPDSLKLQFFKALLDSNAAEQGARMTAMHQATDNATKMIKDLTLVYNKARQAAITKEILEITAGAEALNN